MCRGFLSTRRSKSSFARQRSSTRSTVIAELSRGRHRKTKRSREVDELIVAAHQTMDTEQAAANALQEAARRTTRPKAAALMAEMQASRELMAQAILKAC